MTLRITSTICDSGGGGGARFVPNCFCSAPWSEESSTSPLTHGHVVGIANKKEGMGGSQGKRSFSMNMSSDAG